MTLMHVAASLYTYGVCRTAFCLINLVVRTGATSLFKKPFFFFCLPRLVLNFFTFDFNCVLASQKKKSILIRWLIMTVSYLVLKISCYFLLSTRLSYHNFDYIVYTYTMEIYNYVLVYSSKTKFLSFGKLNCS